MAQPKRKERADVGEGAANGSDGGATAVAVAQPPEGAPWARPGPISRGGMVGIAVLVVAVNLPLLHYYLFRSVPDAPLSLPFQTDFSSPDVLKGFFSTGGMWRIEGGELLSPGVKNNPLWLGAKLPNDVAVEFDVRSMSPEGDIKVEIFGDGSDHGSGYVLIHGGWNNSLSIIARLDEHGAPLSALQAEAQRRGKGLVESGVFKMNTRMRVEANPYPVQPGKQYHWRIERRGGLITWFIDGREFMRFDDPLPLTGEKHNRLGFSSWEAQLFFDNLTVTAL